MDPVILASLIGSLITTTGVVGVAIMQHRQKQYLTANHHSSKKPTLKDWLDDRFTEIKNDVSDVKDDVNRLEKKQDDHLSWHITHRNQ